MSAETKTLIITGASSGIGLATARKFLGEGWQVVNLSRRSCPEPSVHSIEVDMLSPDWLASSLAAIHAQVPEGSHCALVHNAARLVNDALTDAKADVFRSLLELNVTVPMMLSAALLPRMAKGSSVLYVGSTLSEKAVAGAMSYVTSKHALLGLMRASAQDLAGSGIHTALVCPGFTDTEMVRSHISDPEVLQAIGANNGFSRLVQPEEIAETVWFCAANPVINGSVIHANLGQIES